MGKNLAFKNFFLASIIVNIVTALIVIILRNFLPPLLPLFYGQPVGQTQLIGHFGLLIAPMAALLLTILNLSISFSIKDEFLKKILAVSVLVVSVLTTITVAKIVLLVGFF